MKITNNRIINILCGSASILVLWWLREYLSSQWWVFPAPTHVIREMARSDFRVGIGSQSAGIWSSIVASMYRVIAWLAVGMLWAIIVWSVISTSQRVKRFVMPIIQLLAPIAPIAWISVALVLFGIGNSTAIFIVFMWVFFFLTLTVVRSIETVPIRLLQLSKNLGNTPLQTWYRVIIPHIMPSLFTMLRINVMAAWMAVLAAEMTWLRDGLWAIIMTGRNLFDYDLIVFGMWLIAIIWLIIDVILLQIQHRYFWRDSSKII